MNYKLILTATGWAYVLITSFPEPVIPTNNTTPVILDLHNKQEHLKEDHRESVEEKDRHIPQSQYNITQVSNPFEYFGTAILVLDK